MSMVLKIVGVFAITALCILSEFSSVQATPVISSHTFHTATSVRQGRLSALKEMLDELFEDKRVQRGFRDLLEFFTNNGVPIPDGKGPKGNKPEDEFSPENPFGIDPPPQGPPTRNPSNRGKGNKPEDPENPANPFGIDPSPPGSKGSNKGKGAKPEDRDNPDNPFGMDPPPPPRNKDDDRESGGFFGNDDEEGFGGDDDDDGDDDRESGGSFGNDDEDGFGGDDDDDKGGRGGSGGCCGANDLPDSF